MLTATSMVRVNARSAVGPPQSSAAAVPRFSSAGRSKLRFAVRRGFSSGRRMSLLVHASKGSEQGPATEAAPQAPIPGTDPSMAPPPQQFSSYYTVQGDPSMQQGMPMQQPVYDYHQQPGQVLRRPPPPPAPPKESSNPWLWIAVGVGIAVAGMKLVEFIKKAPQLMMQAAMKNAMGGAMGGMGGMPGAPSSMGGGFPMPPTGGSPFAPPPPPRPQAPTAPAAAPAAAAAAGATAAAASFTDVASSPKPAEATPVTEGTSAAKPVDATAETTEAKAEPAAGGASAFSDVSANVDTSFGDAKGANYFSDPEIVDNGSGGGDSASIDLLEKMLEDPKMQEMVYPYLPEGMRNPETFKWMLKNPEFRKQMEGMMGNMGGSDGVNNILNNFDMDSPEVKEQFDQLGVSPQEMISKIMANPEVAYAFQNPRVQQAIMECSNDPMAIMKYQNDAEVMNVFNKIQELFPGPMGAPPGAPTGFPGAPGDFTPPPGGFPAPPFQPPPTPPPSQQQ